MSTKTQKGTFFSVKTYKLDVMENTLALLHKSSMIKRNAGCDKYLYGLV
jgi:hypothetical protein